MHSMLVIGITGGIACGKSLVANQFGRLGASVIDADRLAHDVLKMEIVKSAVKREFGESVFSQDGEVDRKLLGQLVFGSDESKLAVLESITHPVIRRRIENELAQCRALQAPATILDVPLLFKSGWYRKCDRIVFVDVPLSIRIDRAVRIRGWAADELEQREARQTPVSEKIDAADEVIDNSGTPEETFTRVHEIWNQWVDES